MNIRQQKYKENRLVKRMNQTQAALEAGYAFNTATKRSKQLEKVVTADMQEVFEYLGYSDFQIAQKFIALAESNLPNIKLKALEDISEIVGLKKTKVEHSGEVKTGETRIIIIRDKPGDNERIGVERQCQIGEIR